MPTHDPSRSHSPPTPLDTPPAPEPRLAAEAFGTFLLVFGVVGTALFAAELRRGCRTAIRSASASSASRSRSDSPSSPARTRGARSRAATSTPPSRSASPPPVASRGRTRPATSSPRSSAAPSRTTLIVLIGLFGPDGWLSERAGRRVREQRLRRPLARRLRPRRRDHRRGAASPRIFVLVILGVTHATRGTARFAGLAIGLTLTLIHLASIPVDNTSVNPARSIATAIYGGARCPPPALGVHRVPDRRRPDRRLRAPRAVRPVRELGRLRRGARQWSAPDGGGPIAFSCRRISAGRSGRAR